jgi:hypothetical protein
MLLVVGIDCDRAPPLAWTRLLIAAMAVAGSHGSRASGGSHDSSSGLPGAAVRSGSMGAGVRRVMCMRAVRARVAAKGRWDLN